MKHIHYLGKIIILFLLYFATARLGLSIDAVSGFATLVWIPSGISCAALLVLGYRYWPGVYLGAVVVNITIGAPVLPGLGIGIGNTLEALLFYYLFKKLGVHKTFSYLTDVLKFLIIIPFVAGVSAVIGIACLYAGQTLPANMVYNTWQAWIMGDMISILVLTPIFLIWSNKFQTTIKLKHVLEATLLTIFVFFIGTLAFRGFLSIPVQSSSVRYIVFLPIIWAALRFGQRGAVTTVLILSIFAVIETLLGHGSFGSGTLNQRLLYLQSFMGVIAITSLFLAAVETERKNLEKRKDDFISLASHELKTPLTSIKAFTQLAELYIAKKDTAKAAVALQSVAAQMNKLERLVNDLLDISKINAGRMAFRKERLNFPELVTSTVESMQAQSLTHSITIMNQLKNDTLYINGDKDRLHQVLTNLLTNAMKYSPKKKNVIVTMRSTRYEAIVQVKDFGIGLSPEQQGRLFQQYYRAHGNNENSFPGLGMGLYLSYAIIDQHHGRIWVKSKLEKGSTFSYALPLA